MSHKNSCVNRYYADERPSKKRVSNMSLKEWRKWKYCHLRSELGVMFDPAEISNKQYLMMVGGTNYGRIVRGSYS